MSRGIQRERDVVNMLRKLGWWAIRAPASKGDVDVVAIKQGAFTPQRPTHPDILDFGKPTVRFIEVKSTHRGPYHSFGPKDRAELLEAARQAGAQAELCWWPPRGEPQFIPSDDWP